MIIRDKELPLSYDPRRNVIDQIHEDVRLSATLEWADEQKKIKESLTPEQRQDIAIKASAAAIKTDEKVRKEIFSE